MVLKKLSLAYLTIDLTDAKSCSRHKALIQSGIKSTHFTFSLSGDPENITQLPQDTVIVGNAKKRNLPSRLYAIIRFIILSIRHPELFRKIDIFFCRNMDMAIAGFILKRVFGGRHVYEVLDIHPLCTRSDLLGNIARWMDRRLLKHTSLLVTSSPGFVKHYFSQQGYKGKVIMLENKVSGLPQDEAYWSSRRGPYNMYSHQKPVIIGLFGKLRCARSIEILGDVATRLDGRLKVVFAGVPEPDVQNILCTVEKTCKHIELKGPYRYPEDLERLYRSVHFSWCIDLSKDQNAAWLIPNRLYEGGLFGIPALAMSGTETGQMVDDEQLGLSLASPLNDSLVDFVKTLSDENYNELVSRVKNVPVERFLDTGQDLELAREFNNLIG
jgi:succinoglycan biosynthesis protein ExoL